MSAAPPPSEQALSAIRYVLHRAQRDPDLGYHLGLFVEAWEQLVRAEAALAGIPEGEREARRMAWAQRAEGARRGVCACGQTADLCWSCMEQAAEGDEE